MNKFLVVCTNYGDDNIVPDGSNNVHDSAEAALDTINTDRIDNDVECDGTWTFYTVYEVADTFRFSPPTDKGSLVRV